MYYRAHPALHLGSAPVCSGTSFCPPGSLELRGGKGLAAIFTVLPSFSAFMFLGLLTALTWSGYLSSTVKKWSIFNTNILILETKLWSVAQQWFSSTKLLLLCRQGHPQTHWQPLVPPPTARLPTSGFMRLHGSWFPRLWKEQTWPKGEQVTL